MLIPRMLTVEFIKGKRNMFLLLHILMPLLGIGIFLLYYSFSKQMSIVKVGGYLQTLSISLVLLISIVCSIWAEQERKAGNYQNLLTLPYPRILVLMNKYLFLLLSGTCSIIMAAVGFGLGYWLLLGEKPIEITSYFLASLILVGSNLFIYMLHFIISLRWGKNVSIGIGAFGSMVAATLLMLGENIWMYIPYAWGSRFITNFYSYLLYAQVPNTQQLWGGVLTCSISSIAIICVACIWFQSWQGNCYEDE